MELHLQGNEHRKTQSRDRPIMKKRAVIEFYFFFQKQFLQFIPLTFKSKRKNRIELLKIEIIHEHIETTTILPRQIKWKTRRFWTFHRLLPGRCHISFLPPERHPTSGMQVRLGIRPWWVAMWRSIRPRCGNLIMAPSWCPIYRVIGGTECADSMHYPWTNNPPIRFQCL